MPAPPTPTKCSRRPVYWMPDRAAALAVLEGLASAGTLVVVMGAGDVDALGRELVADG